MTYTEHKITLDIHKAVAPVSISVKKGDTARRLLIQLAVRGYPYHISSDCYAVFTAKKPDGKVVINDCTIEDCVIIYEFTEQTVPVPGMMECEIILYGANGKQLTSASFHIIVEDTIYGEDTDNDVESTDEYKALSDLIDKVQELIDSGIAAPSVVAEAEGEVISLQDASNKPLQGLTIYGKTIQDGTPTPDSPVELESLGEEDGEIVLHIDGTTAQSMAISTPNGLPGIPVASGGNYTDADGQAWICDEVNLGRRVYIQRVRLAPISAFLSAAYGEIGSHARIGLGIGNTKYNSIATPNGISNIMPLLGNYSADQLHFYVQNQQLWVFVPIDELEEKTTESVLSWLSSKGAEFLYILATPIERALTEGEIAAYAALHTNKLITTIYNDAGAYMAAEYVADTKTYIDNKSPAYAGIVGEVTLLAAAWTGKNGLYSQVVQIDGVTENSQVDLTPSVEQLAVFYEKDLAFVTENVDGVVTVYAIGQKPTNDYTIQVTITEVRV